MKIHRLLSFAVFGIILTSSFAVHAGNDMSANKGKTESMSTMTMAEIGQKAPDFTLKGADGKEYSLSDFKGKYVVLEWINFDCPFVKNQYGTDNMQTLQSQYTKKGVVWLSICSSAPGKQGNFSGEELDKRIASAKSMATAYLIDADGKVGRMYGAKTTPDMYIINPKGTLIYTGGIDDTPSTKPSELEGAHNYVSAALDAAMSGNAVPNPVTASYGCSVKY